MSKRDTSNWIVPVAGVVAILVTALLQPRFLTFGNLANVAKQSATLEFFAMAQMLPILTRGLDLSQGGIVVMTSVAFGLMAGSIGTAAAAVLAVLIGLIAGFVNGAATSGFQVSPFVVTLGTGSVLQGLALLASNGQPVFNVPPDFSAVFNSTVIGIQVPILVVALLFLSLWYFLERFVWGRYIYAIGSNERAALLSGIPVRAASIAAYTASGAITSIGAVFLASRISSGDPTVGSDTALRAVAAVVIGGVSLFGGRGTVPGVVLGALFLGFLSNALNLINVSSFLQQVVIGVAIILAIVVDKWRITVRATQR